MMADTMAIAGAMPGIGIEALAVAKHLRTETMVEGLAMDETVVTDMAERVHKNRKPCQRSPVVKKPTMSLSISELWPRCRLNAMSQAKS
jgi:hypothetical protein